MSTIKVLGVIPVRLSSKRLHQKHLQIVLGHPLLSWSLRRQLYWSQKLGLLDFVIATTSNSEDAVLESFSKDYGVHFFAGDAQNIPRRFFQAAETFHADAVIAIDGDDIAVSPFAVSAVRKALQEGMSYASTAGLPLGMNVSGFSSSVLKEAVTRSNASVLETGWGRIFKAYEHSLISLSLKTQREDYRLTLDYPEDLEFFKRLIEELGESYITSTDEELISCIETHKLYRINAGLSEEYLRNFKSELKKEEELQIRSH